MSERDAIEKQKAHFESVAEDYFLATQHPNCTAFNDFIWLYFLARHHNILPIGAKVLEPMCGHGIAKEHLQRNIHSDFSYTGFDYSQSLVEIAKARMPEDNIFHQDITILQSPETYDLVFLSGGLHHVYANTRDVLGRLYASLVSGGYLLSAEPTYDNRFYDMVGSTLYKKSDKFDHESEQRYALSDLNEHYRSAGFTIVDQIYPGLAAYIIAVSAFCFPKLCIGSASFIKRLARLESPLYRTGLGKNLSFSTMTLLRKN